MLKVFVGAFFVAIISGVYNLAVFKLLNFYPDLPYGVGIFEGMGVLILLLKNFLVGVVLIYLFSTAYSKINTQGSENMGVFFFILYAVFAFAAFSLGDILLMGSEEGLLLILTVDGFVETMIATVPVSLFGIDRKKG